MKSKKRIGQITTRKIGNKWVVCISGDPVIIFKSYINAQIKANSLREKYGRRAKRK